MAKKDSSSAESSRGADTPPASKGSPSKPAEMISSITGVTASEVDTLVTSREYYFNKDNVLKDLSAYGDLSEQHTTNAKWQNLSWNQIGTGIRTKRIVLHEGGRGIDGKEYLSTAAKFAFGIMTGRSGTSVTVKDCEFTLVILKKVAEGLLEPEIRKLIDEYMKEKLDPDDSGKGDDEKGKGKKKKKKKSPKDDEKGKGKKKKKKTKKKKKKGKEADGDGEDETGDDGDDEKPTWPGGAVLESGDSDASESSGPGGQSANDMWNLMMGDGIITDDSSTPAPSGKESDDMWNLMTDGGLLYGGSGSSPKSKAVPASPTTSPVTPASSTTNPVTPASSTTNPVTPASSTTNPVTPASSTTNPVTPASSTTNPVAPASTTNPGWAPRPGSIRASEEELKTKFNRVHGATGLWGHMMRYFSTPQSEGGAFEKLDLSGKEESDAEQNGTPEPENENTQPESEVQENKESEPSATKKDDKDPKVAKNEESPKKKDGAEDKKLAA